MKRSTIGIVNRLGLMAVARSLQRSRSVVLTYHGVLATGGDGYDFLNHNFISAERFEDQVKYLKKHYRPLALSSLYRAYQKGIAPPERSVAITFDDGFANNYGVAYPILERHGVPFAVFLATGLVGSPGAQLWTERVKRAIYFSDRSSVALALMGREVSWDLSSQPLRAETARTVLLALKRQTIDVREASVASIEAACGRPELSPSDAERYGFLSWAQVKEMASSGVEFGSHTVNHPILTTIDDRALDAELGQSKRDIEAGLGTPCLMFAYPNGSRADFGRREQDALRRLGYESAFSLCGGLNGARPNLYAIDRVNIGRHLDAPLFQAATVGLLGTARRLRARMQVATA